MNAEFFQLNPGPPSSGKQEVVMSSNPRARRIHRWIAIVFTSSVAANFAVMPWGPPPAWITYAPLPPLLILMISGLVMLVSPWIGRSRVRPAMQEGAVR
jgi:hypothetical protein